MGIQPEPFELGCSCPICFAYGTTPKYLKCFIAGVKRGELWQAGMPPSPNGYHDLITQSPLYCQWVIAKPGPYAIQFKLFDTYSRLVVWGSPPDFMFEKTINTKCIFSFSNMWTHPGGRYYYGGHAFVSSAADLAVFVKSITPMSDPNPRLECFPMEDEHIAIRYAGKRDATRIYIKVDTNP